MTAPTVEAIRTELEKVLDPEIRRPITELGMVRSVEVADGGEVVVGIDLTTAGCPLKTTITNDVTQAAERVSGVANVRVDMGVMSEEQRKALRSQLRGGVAEPTIPFAEPGNLTREIGRAHV